MRLLFIHLLQGLIILLPNCSNQLDMACGSSTIHGFYALMCCQTLRTSSLFKSRAPPSGAHLTTVVAAASRARSSSSSAPRVSLAWHCRILSGMPSLPPRRRGTSENKKILRYTPIIPRSDNSDQFQVHKRCFSCWALSPYF